jgi:hypothetical protein
MKNIITLSILSFIILSFMSIEVLAIPAFARKYNMSCKTCHSPFPALKPYGDEFAGNGLQLQDKDAPRYFVETGDDKLDLIRDFPIAVRIQGFVTYNDENEYQWDIGAPSGFKVMTGGAITNDVAYYVYYILEDGEVGKIEDAWVMFNNLFSTELDFTIGQFQVCDPLFKRELRLTNEDYEIYKVRPGESGVNLTYDRGVFANYSFPTSTDLVFELVNGSGISELNPNNLFDSDKFKNILGRVSQDLGDNFRLGGFIYYGNETGSSDTIRTYENEITFWGIDATLAVELFELNLQYGNRNDSNPFFVGLSIPEVKKNNLKTYGGFAELIFRPKGDESDWYTAILYNHINSDDEEVEYRTLALHLGYVLRRNIRLIGEFAFDINNEFERLAVGFVTAF